MRSITRLPPKRGFTLIELIMAIVVVAIISIPLSLLLSQQIGGVFASEDLTMALNLARAEMEKVNNLDYADITTAHFSGYEGYDYDVFRTVNYAGGNAKAGESLKRVRVRVKKSGAAADLVGITTYIAKNLNYGL